jgi:glyoxylase-like metal-dependent hydrolase (beta-lactamase superfamily II)
MKRAAVLFFASIVLVSCATIQPRGQSLVSRAVQAAGGADALAAVSTVSLRGTVREWEPEQSMVAGGEMRFACESVFEAMTDVGAGATRIDWARSFAYPAPRAFTYTEIVTREAGYVAGVDSNARTKQSLEAKPPAHTMSGLRLAAAQRELRRSSPVLLLEMAKNPSRVTAVEDVTAHGVAYPAVAYQAGDQTFTVMFDPATGLPARIRTLDYDNVWGDVTYDLVLADWQPTAGVRIATTRRYELNGRLVSETKLTGVQVNRSFSSDLLAIPETFGTGASRPATGAVPYQWVLRRQFIGIYLDSDSPGYDAKATSGLRLVELAPGVQHAVGGSHNSLAVELRDSLIVFDSPVSDAQSSWLLGALKAKYSGKPVKYLVLTHHHMDHTGGLRAYAAQGATIIVGKGAGEHFRRVLAAPFTRNPDLPARDLSKTPIVEVADRHVITDGQREVHAYRIDNPHVEGMLIGYVPDAKIGFVTDIWSPGAPLPDKLNPALAALVGGVKKAGITPARFAGGHGGVADYGPLAALEGK